MATIKSRELPAVDPIKVLRKVHTILKSDIPRLVERQRSRVEIGSSYRIRSRIDGVCRV